MKVIALSILLLVMARPCLSAEIVHLATDNWCPYSCIDEGKVSGIVIDVAEAMFEGQGIKVIWSIVDWEDALKGVRDGTFDGAAGMVKSEGPDFIFHSHLLTKTSSCFISPASSSWRYKNTDSLLQARIGVYSGYSYGSLLDEFLQEHAKRGLVKAEYSGFVLKKLVAALDEKRIDVVLEDQRVWRYYAHKFNQTGKYREDGCQPIGRIYVGFSPARRERSTRLANLADKGLYRMYIDGSRLTIEEKYMLEQPSSALP